MSEFTDYQLSEAARSIESTLHKCEKAILKLKEGTSSHTLTARRIDAFNVALALIAKERAASDETPNE